LANEILTTFFIYMCAIVGCLIALDEIEGAATGGNVSDYDLRMPNVSSDLVNLFIANRTRRLIIICKPSAMAVVRQNLLPVE
jgi:hypothetical protein